MACLHTYLILNKITSKSKITLTVQPKAELPFARDVPAPACCGGSGGQWGREGKVGQWHAAGHCATSVNTEHAGNIACPNMPARRAGTRL
ncbi:jg15778 [Pararge aegeria aegeria]|uniref:Jg15778 protein n=1 Tax=Pararge aegeria aegeria TaxID=348720 RepID=A0A8S4RHW0_9NEOP|nr:jg15778 [Pararge aegeria aegeria]